MRVGCVLDLIERTEQMAAGRYRARPSAGMPALTWYVRERSIPTHSMHAAQMCHISVVCILTLSESGTGSRCVGGCVSCLIDMRNQFGEIAVAASPRHPARAAQGPLLQSWKLWEEPPHARLFLVVMEHRCCPLGQSRPCMQPALEL